MKKIVLTAMLILTAVLCMAQTSDLSADRRTIDIYPSVYASLYSEFGNRGKNAATLQYVFDEIDDRQKTICLDEGKWEICSDLTIPANVSIYIKRGTYLCICEDVTLTIEGELLAGAYRIFDCPGNVIATNAKYIVVWPEWGDDHHLDGFGQTQFLNDMVRDVSLLPTNSIVGINTLTNADGTKEVILDFTDLDDYLGSGDNGTNGLVRNVYYGGTTSNLEMEVSTTLNDDGSKEVSIQVPRSWASAPSDGKSFVLTGIVTTNVRVGTATENIYTALIPMVGNKPISFGVNTTNYITSDGKLIVPENGYYSIIASASFTNYMNPHRSTYINFGLFKHDYESGSSDFLHSVFEFPYGTNKPPMVTPYTYAKNMYAPETQINICIRRGAATDINIPELLVFPGSRYSTDNGTCTATASILAYMEAGQHVYMNAYSGISSDRAIYTKALSAATAVDYVPNNTSVYSFLSISKVGGDSEVE